MLKRSCLAIIFTSVLLLGQQRDDTLSVDVDLVNILFTVTDKSGKLIPDLKKENFKVIEDGSPQIITNFSSETDLPLTIALLIDTSASVRDRLRAEQDAAIEFFQSTLIRGKDRAVVISFDTGVDLVQDYTDDPDALAKSVRQMQAGGSTALYDAVYLAATRKLAEQSGRRILVIISDGEDTSSRITEGEAFEAAQRNDVVIYAISTNAAGFGGQKGGPGDKILRRFSGETGGRVFSPARLQDLPSNFRAITQELRTQYTLAYRSTNSRRDGSFRRVRMEPLNRRYLVRARNGYYAPAAAQPASRGQRQTR
jgi:Ca-activated chloride channel family protein